MCYGSVSSAQECGGIPANLPARPVSILPFLCANRIRILLGVAMCSAEIVPVPASTAEKGGHRAALTNEM